MIINNVDIKSFNHSGRDISPTRIHDVLEIINLTNFRDKLFFNKYNQEKSFSVS